MKRLKFIIYKYLLLPFIMKNYIKRIRGEAPDEWYWADVIAIKLGHYTSYEIEAGFKIYKNNKWVPATKKEIKKILLYEEKDN